jgi:hypothetical protein
MGNCSTTVWLYWIAHSGYTEYNALMINLYSTGIRDINSSTTGMVTDFIPGINDLVQGSQPSASKHHDALLISDSAL